MSKRIESESVMPQARQKYKMNHEECPLHPEKEWRRVPGFEDHLMVSSCGDVWLHKAFPGPRADHVKTPRLVRLSKLKNGYVVVQIQTRRHRAYYVHRLVLSAFRGKPETGMECAHLDGTRDNNHLSNLQWVSRSDNANHRHGHGTCHCGERGFTVKLTVQQVHEIRQALRDGGMSQGALALRYGVSQSLISLIALGKRWRHLDSVSAC